MGDVYEAHDVKLDRPVALKVLRAKFIGDAEYRRRFLREARSAAAVTHPFIASIHDAGETDGTLFIAMEFVEGQSLRALLNEEPIPVAEAARYATEIAEGLAKAHRFQLVHRDLKPDNVMIGSDGHVKILDFGLAKLVEKRDLTSTLAFSEASTALGELTIQGSILGTPAYMSPEQARGEPVDTRSDVFSFGSTVYEMLTRTSPFRRDNAKDTLAAIQIDTPVSVSKVNSAVPASLDRILAKCLEKDPDDRYVDAGELAADLANQQSTNSPSLCFERLPGISMIR